MIKTIKELTVLQQVLAIILVITLVSCGGSGSSTGEKSVETPTTPTEPITDTTPNAFDFSAKGNVEPDSLIASAQITISGINAPASISITGGEYSINNANFTSAAGTIKNNDKIQISITSSSNPLTESIAQLTIGGTSGTFRITTKAVKSFTGVNVDINFNTKHSVGGIESFDRQKFITIHASASENDWGENDAHSRNAPNKDPNLMVNFVTDNDVYFGRDTGSIGWALRNVNEDPVNLALSMKLSHRR
ncbi:hypothetical protein L3081_11805 [Colwellia sp. MSW7]|uniref:Uncharacterized protein n=1 Tax=Colwellia maritima TaxID=2912588 RepID=A0ABS9X3A4_9GAMM|nr:hypothetical protein [Colwellia maritima]MCI2283961.1 hypothetical protein [Colwellia maritima]